MNTQTTFAHALLHPELPCPSDLTTWNGSDPEIRFAVYRNNVMVSLVDALASSYPVVQMLVGEEFFRAMAREFAQTNPPQSKVMAYYGRDFAAFLSSFPPAASVPYLADVARLEMARVLACHAADVDPIEAETLHAALAAPTQLPSLRLVLHPSVQVIASEFAVFSLWAAHQGAWCISSVDPDRAQAALVFRNGLDVQTLALDSGAAALFNALQTAQTLMEATKAASRVDPGFDLSRSLALLIRWQLITHVTTGDQHNEYTP